MNQNLKRISALKQNDNEGSNDKKKITVTSIHKSAYMHLSMNNKSKHVKEWDCVALSKKEFTLLNIVKEQYADISAEPHSTVPTFP